MLNDYAITKEKLTALSLRLDKAVENTESRQTLAKIGRKVADNEFCLVVVGQFKRGKTSFINALLGEDLLPVAVIPLTSIITEIRWGESLSIDVHFNDGTARNVSPGSLVDYVSEKHNPHNVKNVKIVRIRHASNCLKGGVRIIDTPGVASVHSHNTEMTYSYLPNADAAIFLVGSDPPITEAESHFLNDLRGFAARLFFVQNKIDMVSALERQESLAFTRQIIEQQLGASGITIFALSAKYALEGKLAGDAKLIEESGLPAFESMLEAFLMEEKGDVLLESAANKIQNVIGHETFSARLLQRTLAEPLKDLEQKIKYFADAEVEIAQERSDSNHLVRAEARELVADVLIPDLDNFREEQSRLLVQSVDAHNNSLEPLANRDLAAELNMFLHSQIHETFDGLLIREESVLREKLEAMLTRFVTRTNLIIDRIVTLSSSIFEIEIEPFVIDESLARESGFQFKIDEDVKVSLEYITESVVFLLPRLLARRLILKSARERMKEQVERHCGRLRRDFLERIEASVEDFRNQLDETVESSLEGIRQALDAGHRAREEDERGISDKEARLAKRLALFERALADLDELNLSRKMPLITDRED